MGRKRASYFVSRVGKQSSAQIEFKWTKKDNSGNTKYSNNSNTGLSDVNKRSVNTNDNVNIVNITDNPLSTPTQ